MVQPADFGKLHDLPRCGELDRPAVGRVLVKREVCARPMGIGDSSSWRSCSFFRSRVFWYSEPLLLPPASRRRSSSSCSFS